ncbi:beta-lactamase family protein [Candidatus Sumerlaeota bacterium]|nr:serine hydrolase [Candidatus Sumerlaeales bacterium]NLD62194.1 beta-lactamase family protein [Candidatus Sumerlaeota bacterium]
MKITLKTGAALMMLSTVLCAASLATATPALVLHETTPVPEEFVAIDKLVQKGITDDVYPGAVLVIGRHDDILFSKCYGRQTYETTAPLVDFNTYFDMASVTKVMGPTMATMKLYENGKLKPSDLVTKYLPEYGVNGKENTTIEHLITHTSGLIPYLVHKEITKIVDAGTSKGLTASQSLLNHYCNLKPTAKPGTSFKYSCLNMQTMAAIDEKICGESLENYLRATVWGDAGLNATTYHLSPEAVAHTMPTVGDLKTSAVTRVGIVHDPLAAAYISKKHCSGNAGVFSTGNDVARFCQMVANKGKVGDKQVLKEKTVLEMTELRTSEPLATRTWGWGVYDSPKTSTPLNNTDGNRCVGHTGYTGTLVWIDMRSGTYVVLLTNRVFPDDRNQPAGHLSVGKVRTACINTALKTVEEYKKFFK